MVQLGMTILQAIFFGIVEGITEFLPISSTFHLILTAKFLSLPQSDFVKLFEVFIQSGAILSVVILYYRMLLKDWKLVQKVMVAFIPTAIIGFALHEVIKNVFFESEMLMYTAFGVVGILFLLVELLVKKGKLTLSNDLDKLTYKQAIIIGTIQALAVVPGVSRAGAVIVGMMFLGYRRDHSASFSFLLAIPTIFAASALDGLKMREVIMSNTQNLNILLIGCFAAFVSSYIIVNWFIKFIQRNSLLPFAYYRFLVLFILWAATI